MFSNHLMKQIRIIQFKQIAESIY